MFGTGHKLERAEMALRTALAERDDFQRERDMARAESANAVKEWGDRHGGSTTELSATDAWVDAAAGDVRVIHIDADAYNKSSKPARTLRGRPRTRNTPNSASLWNGIAPHRLSVGEVNIQSRWIVIVPTPKEYRHQAEECLALAGEATELYAKAALLELAAEFREKAEGLEHYGAWHEA